MEAEVKNAASPDVISALNAVAIDEDSVLFAVVCALFRATL